MAEEPPIANVPAHVAIIMDGNGRWASRRGLPRAAGHRAGTQNIRPLLEAAAEFGVQYLTIWAFSTENWVRPKEEVGALMRLLLESLDRWLPELHEKGVRLLHIGNLDRLPLGLQDRIRQAIELTHSNNRITLTVAFDYGGRDELVRAVRRLIADGVQSADVTEDLIGSYLDTADLPEPDLVIRTANEFRTSNFMIWETAYSEYYISPVLWPDFDRAELYRALSDYSHRERRFGGLRPVSTSPHRQQ
ncbi:MAG: di-trans,poly-cis-decaprenylcistransferase [Anaerolineae bacterium]|nr:di-trans,poly-cis-decaprenylcistransferase [Anaerolineae bacterium]